MKVVLDTNVLISGTFFSGPPSKILSCWKEGNFTAVISESIIAVISFIIFRDTFMPQLLFDQMKREEKCIAHPSTNGIWKG